LWPILLQKSLAVFVNGDSVAVMWFATGAAMMGRLNHNQEQFFYSFRACAAAPNGQMASPRSLLAVQPERRPTHLHI